MTAVTTAVPLEVSSAVPARPARDSIATWKLLLFALPAAPHAFVAMPLMVVLPSFYAGSTAVTLAQIAAIATLSRIFDAVADPVVGFLSDLTRTRLGLRKPWLLAAALICPLAIFFLFQPPPDATVTYYALWSTVLYVGFTFFEIPRMAWAAELTRDYSERSRVSVFVALFNIGGSLVFWLMPLALYQFTGTTAITGATVHGIAWMYTVVMPTALLLAIIFVPVGVPQIQRVSGSALRALVESVRRCRPLWSYLSIIGLWGLGQGAFMSMMYIYITDYMKLGDKFAFLMIAYFIVQLAAMPVWTLWLRRLERHQAWALALGIDAVARCAILLLPPGAESFYPALVVVFVTAFFNAPANFMPQAIVGDVIDYNTLKTGTNKAANFYAINTLVIKSSMALGTGAAFAVIAAAHYQVGAANDAGAQWGLIVAYLGIPTVLHVAAALWAWRFALTRSRHDTVRQRLERLERRASGP